MKIQQIIMIKYILIIKIKYFQYLSQNLFPSKKYSSNKNKMWNKISSNKHLDKLAKQQAYRKHITTLYKMRPTIKVKPPTEFQFLKNKPKLEVHKRQREDQIEKENYILVKKMLQKDSSLRGSQSVYIKDSLNSKIIKDKQRLIDMQNQRLVKKIKAVNSEYSKSRLQKDAQKYDKLKSSFAHSRMQEAYDLLQDPAETKMRYHKSMNRPRTAKV